MPVLKPARGIQLNKSHPLARGLVGCWLLNAATGRRVFDLSGRAAHGDLDEGSPTWVQGKFGAALDFDGNDGVRTGTKSSLVGDSPFTVIACIRTSSHASSKGLILSQRNGGYAGAPQTAVNNGKVWQCFNNKFDNHSSANSVNDGVWHQIAVVYDQSNCIFYIDGVYDSEHAESGNSFNSAISTSIGFDDRDNADYFIGRIDHIYRFARALSAAEISWLYREPFCMFAPAVSPALLFIESGGVEISGQVDSSADLTASVELTMKAAGSFAATATVAGSLKSTVTLVADLAAYADLSGSISLPEQIVLVGTISAAAVLSARLASAFNWPWFGASLQIETTWLREALFHGMTANAYKLGTTLSLGWFWVRRSGCCGLFRGLSMEQIDCVNLLAVTDADACSLEVPNYIPHDSDTTCYYLARRFNNCGYQEHTLHAAVKVSVDTSGDLAKPQPNRIFAWKARQTNGNKVQLVWFYCPVQQHSKPVRFNVYWDSGTGQIDYENPLATVNYKGRRFYNCQTDLLAAEGYRFALRVEDANGVQDSSGEQLRIQLATASPEPADILSADPV
jgi:hypothetical protein